MRRALLVLWVFCLASCGGGDRDRTPQVVVFAAASLRDVATEIGHAFESSQVERRHPAEVVFNFAGSNTLAHQIEAAPKADVFLSADQKWIEFLDRSGRLVPGSKHRLLSNRLVLIAQRDSRLGIDMPADLIGTDYRFLAVADPEAVPAGRYARSYLEHRTVDGVSLWSRLETRLAPAQDVRAALALVESDPEILGIVYRTDALTSERVRVVYEFPPLDEVPITYWGARVEGSDAPDLGERFLDFLRGTEATAIIERYGFLPS